MPKILIIDDSTALATFLRDVLMRKGYFVFTADNGNDGLALFQAQKPDLALLGIHVRRGLGWGTLLAIKDVDPKAAFIVLASTVTEEAEDRAASLGCRAFLSKEMGLEAFSHEVGEAVAAAVPLPGVPKTPAHRGRILVVDDDSQVRAILERFLRLKGYQVVTAENGQEGLNQIKRERPHIMLLDIDMPVMGGLEALKRVREIDREISVIMISGTQDRTAAEETLRLGAVDYISKPLNFQYLETTVMTKLILMTA